MASVCLNTLKVNNVIKPEIKTKKKYNYVPPLKKIERNNNFLSIAERVNGRCAMIGFSSALIEELMTGNSVSTQFHDNIGLAVAVSGLTFLGTVTNNNDEGYVSGFFTPDKELVNGRLAMIGMISLLLTETLDPSVAFF